MNKAPEHAISPTRKENFPEWYQEVIKEGELAESSAVRGCMVIRPWGYGVWEAIQRQLDERIKATGHENAYFPLFIPLSFLEKEAAHVEGFAKECAVVTHHRLEERNGKLVPTGELEEPLIVRPTSETIIGESFSRWVQSYRDLPLLINQWANVVRWEMRTRVFLRTSEFLWQEGHTVHASEEEALKETLTMHGVYTEFIREVLAIPGIPGEKAAYERFPGAVRSFCVEAMMQDGKALQAATSHYLGQNFAKASQIRFLDKEGVQQYAYTTSWGASTRLIGGMIMTHGDDDGLRIPPRVASKQVVILPVIPKPELEGAVLAYCEELAQNIAKATYHGRPVAVHIDKRDLRGGEKNWQWIKRGAPIRIEVGPRDLEKRAAVLYRRDNPTKEKIFLSADELPTKVPEILDSIQKGYLAAAQTLVNTKTETGLSSFEDLRQYFTEDEGSLGFVRAKWSGDSESVAALTELKVSIRCIPDEQSGTVGRCILTGKEATQDAIFAKAY